MGLYKVLLVDDEGGHPGGHQSENGLERPGI